jgi:hypothetical protein
MTDTEYPEQLGVSMAKMRPKNGETGLPLP